MKESATAASDNQTKEAEPSQASTASEYPYGLGPHQGPECKCCCGAASELSLREGGPKLSVVVLSPKPPAPPPPRAPVVLNVYDLFWTNNLSSKIGVGVYHSGVEVRK